MHTQRRVHFLLIAAHVSLIIVLHKEFGTSPLTTPGLGVALDSACSENLIQIFHLLD